MRCAWPSLASPSTTPILARRRIRTQINQQARTSFQPARSIQALVQLAAGALAPRLTAHPPPDQQTTPHDSPLTDQLGQLRPGLAFGRGHPGPGNDPVLVCHTYIMSDY